MPPGPANTLSTHVSAISTGCNAFERDSHSASYIGTLCIFLAHLYWVTIFSEGWIGYVCITCNDPGPSLGRHLTVSGFFHKPKLSELPFSAGSWFDHAKSLRHPCISKCGEAQEETIHCFHTIYIYNYFFPIASRNNNLSVRNPNFVETSHIRNTHHAWKNPQIARCFFFSQTQSTLVAPRGESNVGNFVPDLHRSLPIDPQPKPKTTAKNCFKAPFEL